MRVPMELLAILVSSSSAELGSLVLPGLEYVPPAWLIPTKGKIQSDNYPNNYGNNVDTNYTIQVRPGKLIKIQFTDMEIEKAKNRCNSNQQFPRCCPYDSVTIMDPQTGTVLLRRACGTILPPVTYSLSQQVLVTFQTDKLNVYRGWSLDWQEVCGPNTPESTNVLQSPNYPKNYPSSVDRNYTLEVTEGSNMWIQFTDFKTEQCCDYVTILSPQDGTVLLERFSGNRLPKPIRTPSHQALVIFRSDDSYRRQGWRLKWQQIDC